MCRWRSREKNLNVQDTRMLWSSYIPKRYNFEVFELLRKLFQTSVFVLPEQTLSGRLCSSWSFAALPLSCLVGYDLISTMQTMRLLNGVSGTFSREFETLAFSSFAHNETTVLHLLRYFNRINAIGTDAQAEALNTTLMVLLISVPVICFILMLGDLYHPCSGRGARESVYLAKLKHFGHRFCCGIRFALQARPVVQTDAKANKVKSALYDLNTLVMQLDEEKSGTMNAVLKALENDYITQLEVSQAKQGGVLRTDVDEMAKLKSDVILLIEKNDDLVFKNELKDGKIDMLTQEVERLTRELEVLTRGSSHPRTSVRKSLGIGALFSHGGTAQRMTEVVSDSPEAQVGLTAALKE